MDDEKLPEDFDPAEDRLTSRYVEECQAVDSGPLRRRHLEFQDRERMTGLARSFPCLRGAPGIAPFEPQELDRWAGGPASHGERVTASFVLAVWDASTDWDAGRFDLMEALRVWPRDHREPFLRWSSDPWWP